MLIPGTSFAGYTIQDHLNQGGMADIYSATDLHGQRFVLRILLAEHRYHWLSIRRFRWGCWVLSQLDHPNIARLFAAGKHQGRRYAVLEHVDGANLKERILRSDPVLRTSSLQLLTGMAAGLAHIHERGFLHLDFKPENVVLSRNCEPKILDLDLSVRRPKRPQRIPRLSGTPTYLAPEQIMRQPVDERADIFAFGITAYELLTGRKPVSGDTRRQLLEKYTDFGAHLKPLRDYLPGIHPLLEQIVLKCLEKDLERRYPSMQLVLRDLRK
jgi:serine/threonine-protein kinase